MTKLLWMLEAASLDFFKIKNKCNDQNSLNLFTIYNQTWSDTTWIKFLLLSTKVSTFNIISSGKILAMGQLIFGVRKKIIDRRFIVFFCRTSMYICSVMMIRLRRKVIILGSPTAESNEMKGEDFMRLQVLLQSHEEVI